MSTKEQFNFISRGLVNSDINNDLLSFYRAQISVQTKNDDVFKKSLYVLSKNQSDD